MYKKKGLFETKPTSSESFHLLGVPRIQCEAIFEFGFFGIPGAQCPRKLLKG